MKVLFYLMQKEFIQIFRNRIMLPILFVMPVVQLLVLTYAANFEIKNIRLHVVDRDVSQTSARLAAKLQGSGYFIIAGQSPEMNAAYESIENDRSDLILTIPAGFEKSLHQSAKAEVQAMINAINGTKAALANSYLQSIVRDFHGDIRFHSASLPPVRQGGIQVQPRNWFNPQLDYKIYMAPGILALLVTMIALFLTSMNIVREKEIGTIEQLNVTTIRKYQFVIGKLAPFWIIALAEFHLGLLIVAFLFNTPLEGSFPLMFAFTNIYLLAMLGFGMFISTIAHTQQQAMFTSWFFMVIFILMSGLFTPIEYMPEWAKAIARFNPVAYFVEFMRMITLKGSGFGHVWRLFVIISVYALAINALAVWNYKKTTT